MKDKSLNVEEIAEFKCRGNDCPEWVETESAQGGKCLGMPPVPWFDMQRGDPCIPSMSKEIVRLRSAQIEAARPPVSHFRTLVEAKIEDWRERKVGLCGRMEEQKETLRRINSLRNIPEYDSSEGRTLRLDLQVIFAADAELTAKEWGLL